MHTVIEHHAGALVGSRPQCLSRCKRQSGSKKGKTTQKIMWFDKWPLVVELCRELVRQLGNSPNIFSHNMSAYTAQKCPPKAEVRGSNPLGCAIISLTADALRTWPPRGRAFARAPGRAPWRADGYRTFEAALSRRAKLLKTLIVDSEEHPPGCGDACRDVRRPGNSTKRSIRPTHSIPVSARLRSRSAPSDPKQAALRRGH